MPSPKAMLESARAKAPWLDHLIRAAQRYQADTGDRLAAAVTYFGFLSFFPLLALAASLLAMFIGDDAIDQVVQAVDDYAPGLADQLGLQDILANNTAAGVAGIASLAGLLYSGTGWVDALRQAVRTMWHQNVQAGNLLKKKLADVVILAGLGAALIASVLVSAVAGAFTDSALGLVGLEGSLVASVLVTIVGTVLAIATSTVIFLYLFIRLPKVDTPWRKVFKGALLAAVLFEIFKRIGAIYIERTTENPLYGVFAVVVGLLVWINLVSRLLLFCAAWTVTAPYDSDVAPSGTADAEQARKADIPLEFADDNPDSPPAIEKDGAPTPLRQAVEGRLPSQDEPEGRPGEREPMDTAARRATGGTAWAGPGESRPPSSDAADAGLSDGPDQRQAGAPVGAGAAAGRSGGRASQRHHDGGSAGTGSSSGGGTGTLVEPQVRPLRGEAATRRAAQVGAGVIGAGLAALAVYVVSTLRRLFLGR